MAKEFTAIDRVIAINGEGLAMPSQSEIICKRISCSPICFGAFLWGQVDVYFDDEEELS